MIVTAAISVIIPTLNEAARLPLLLAAIAREKTPHEVIVVDGGSADGSLELASNLGARILRAPGGRGAQLAAGTEAATGDVLLFLHADTVFPEGGLAAIVSALAASPDCIGGNFRLLFDGGDRFSRWLTGFYHWIRRRGLYYGDSGIFVRHDSYRAAGGIRPIALMEDYDFVRRMERLGPTAYVQNPPLITSSRRFVGRHAVAIVCGWLVIHALFWLNVSPDRLARIYKSNRQ